MTDYLNQFARYARIPEHSLPLMCAMSGGEPFYIGEYLFLAANDWIMGIGYPLNGNFDEKEFEKAFNDARKKTKAKAYFVICPKLPESMASHIIDRDRYYVLSTGANIPARLRNQAKRATKNLTVRESSEFTPQHRRLWAEFLERSTMTGRVAALYAQTPRAMNQGGGNLRLLDAIDADGNIVATLLLDYAPDNFVSYILGAHSRLHYIPHAADLLFQEMITRAGLAGKTYIHLGLGVNEGILRFKRKWGAVPSHNYVMAQWDVDDEAKEPDVVQAFAMALMKSGNLSARQALDTGTSIKPFAMLWQLEKNNRVSWIGGSAHFFYHSFEPSFRKLYKNVDNVIFEGPLDSEFMAQVDKAGKTPPPGYIPLIEYMSEDEILRLERKVYGPRGKLFRALGMEMPCDIDVRWLLQNALPWNAFFTLWTAFLERKGWKESVDMEAWNIARDMGKNVIAMENMEEQLESLGSLPVDRVLRFFRDCETWDKRARNNLHAYLAGDLEKMMGSSAEFPTRTEHVVGRRDQRFRERMRPWLEKGRTAVFVGTAHMVNLRHMLAADGFRVRQAPFGIWPKIHRAWRRASRSDEEVTW